MPEAAVTQTLLGFDYGTRYIGVAIGNTLTKQAHALANLSSRTRSHRFAQITALIEQWQPDRVIVGLPLASDGSEQLSTIQARRFANQLRGRYGVEVDMVDERGSSMEAQERLGRHGPDHAEAAAIILQRYLDQIASEANHSQSVSASGHLT